MLNGLKNIYNLYVERYKKRFIYCFGIYFILVILGGLIGFLNPNLAIEVKRMIGSQFVSSMPGLFQAISAGKILTVILTIFGINSVVGTFLTITVPNMVGLGTLIFIYRPLLWGLIYAPISPQDTVLLLKVIPTLLLEGTAYVIAFAASLDLVLAIVKPDKLGEESRLKALKKAWIYNLKSYALVLIVLFVAAVVETITIIFGL
jgi:hypothetical protein